MRGGRLRSAVVSNAEEIRQSIEARLVEVRSEISSLQAARSALSDRRPATPRVAAAAAPKRTNNRSHSSSAPSATNAASPAKGAEGTPLAASPSAAKRVEAKAGTVARAPRERKPTAIKAPQVLLAGKLAAMLQDADGSLSASVITKRGNARVGQVRALLRELESSGQVRRTGAGRAVRWRLVTDEERVAERAAELERLSARKR